MKNLTVKILFLLLIGYSNGFPQTEPDSNIIVQIPDSTFIMNKSPWGAVLRSAIIPGWGQYYNESYWKIPLIWGISGWFVYAYIHNNDLTIKYRDLYNQSISNGDPNERYRQLREFYKDERNLFAIYLGLTYFLNLVDAYVDAHLFDFDVSPTPFTNSPQLNIKFYFH